MHAPTFYDMELVCRPNNDRRGPYTRSEQHTQGSELRRELQESPKGYKRGQEFPKGFERGTSKMEPYSSAFVLDTFEIDGAFMDEWDNSWFKVMRRAVTRCMMLT